MKKRQIWSLIPSSTRFAFLVFLSAAAPLIVSGQETTKRTKLNNLQRIQALHIDSLERNIRSYHSKGYRDRAIAMSDRIQQDLKFYKDSLGIDVKILLGLLDRTDFDRARIKTAPYGMPFEDEKTGMIIMPADNTGAVIDAYEPFKRTVSDKVIADLKKAGFTYGEAVRNMVDLIALHEIGHLEIHKYGIKARQPWFNEFLATYMGYAYMRNREPKMAVVWDHTTHAGYVGYKPKYRSLDQLNKLYFGVGSDNYVWYQNAFQERIHEVFEKRGLDFIRLVGKRFSDPAFKPVTAQELLAELEKIEPGFFKWAASLEH